MSKKLIIILVAVVALLGGGGAVAFFMFRGEEAAPVEVVVEHKPGIVNLESFLANVNDPAGDRYAKLTLQLAVVPDTLATEMNEDAVTRAKMRDRVLTLLTSKSVAQLIDPIGKEDFRRELKAALAPLLEKGEIQEVLFSDFVVQ